MLVAVVVVVVRMGVELTAVNLVALGVASVVAGFAAGLTSFGRGVLFHTSWLLASVLVGIQGNVTDAVSILAFQVCTPPRANNIV